MRIKTFFHFLKNRGAAILTAVILLFSIGSNAQSVQTIRGQIVDGVSNQPLIGVSVRIVDSNSALGSITDGDGNYRIADVVVGRHTLQITYIGYEVQTIPNVVVTAGKEIVLNISLAESINQLEEVTVVGDTRYDKTATNNDLAVVSARSFNVDDTKRYAGAIGDPSRMAANFAGVVGGNDSRNDLVVRGNSSLGMLFQLEGLNIPNPNHFGALASTGGPISMLNNNNLDKSDFMTSAFPAQYGNAVAGVFDLSMRDGNNETTELMAQVGFNGFEFGAEGPFSKKSKASYIVNARYSTLGVFSALGIDFGTGSAVPNYQDINFKINVPTKKGGTWSLFGLGGNSTIDLLGSEADLKKNSKDLYGSENQDSYPRYQTGILGVSYEKNISSKTFAKFTAGVTATYEDFILDSLVRDAEYNVIDRYLRLKSESGTLKYSFNFMTRTKLNAKNSVTSGFYTDMTNVDLFRKDYYPASAKDTVRYDINDNTALYQVYSTWKHRFNQNVSAQVGVHGQYYNLNKQFVAEPRVGVQYVINAKHSLSVGYGLHHQAQNYYTSFLQTKTTSGNVIYTNKKLDFTRSNHVVLTYDWNISEKLRLKAETYYQRLSRVPIEQKPSTFSILNTGGSFGPEAKDSLVNTGVGTNYGLELTAERFFNDGYYFLITTSLFDSKYKGSDDVKRNTAFNTKYVFNALAGKEWAFANKSRFFSVNLKFTTIGGRYLTPLDFSQSQQLGYAVYKENEAFTDKQKPYVRIDLRISYRREYAKSTLETSIDFQNVINYKNVFAQSYNPRTGDVITLYQQGFFPVPYVRLTF
jgi:hypothetical protein